MSRAAEVLHLTTPAVSMHLKVVNAQVGLSLFDRQGRTLSWPTAGDNFLVHARRLMIRLMEADDAMARFKRPEHGSLTINIISTAKCFVLRLLARCHEEHLGMELLLRVVGVLSPVAEAFRYFMLAQGEARLREHDAALLHP